MLSEDKVALLINSLQFTDLNRMLIHFGIEKGRLRVESENKAKAFLSKISKFKLLELYHFFEANKFLFSLLKPEDFLECMDRDDIHKLFSIMLRRNEYFLNSDELQDEFRDVQFETIVTLEEVLKPYELADLKAAIDLEDYEFFEINLPDFLKMRTFFHVLEVDILDEELSDSKYSDIKISSNYDFRLLNINIEPEAFIEKLKLVLDYIRAPGAKEFYSYGAVFEGPSGTGKTEFAKKIAFELNLPLAYKSFGSFSSGYHGETESNINKFFDEAAEDEAIIFIDEADSMFFTREKATQDFQVSIVNEMLVQIEKYPGIVICSTNLLNLMDKALSRRMPEKISFNYLTTEQSSLAFREYFKVDLNFSDISKLKQVTKLSLGDFKVVRQKTFFDKNVSNAKLIELLASEVSFRSRLA